MLEGVGGEGLWNPQELWAEGGGRLQQVFCYKARDETEEPSLEEQRERERAVI